MREHERLEKSSMGVKWVLEEHSQISLHLGGTYEQQGFGATTKTQKNTKNQKNKKRKGCFQWLTSHGSFEGKVEAQHMINERYDSVYAVMREKQTRWLGQNRPEVLRQMMREDDEGRPYTPREAPEPPMR